MKIVITIISCSLLFIACNPGIPGFGGTPIAFKAEVINAKDTIPLGDSIAFYLELPDSVYYNGSRIKTYVTGKDGAEVSLFPKRIDPNTGNISAKNDLGRYYANPGNVTNIISLNLTNLNGKLTGKFYYIPVQKGVYFLEVQQNGIVYINNASIKAENTFNFGAIDRHHYLIRNNVNPSLNIEAFFADKANRSLEVYAFYVK